MSVVIVDGALHVFNVTKFNLRTRRVSEAIVHRGREAQCSVTLSWLQLSGVPHTPRMSSSCMLMAHRSGALLITLVSCQHEIVVHIVDNVQKPVSFCFDGSPRVAAHTRSLHQGLCDVCVNGLLILA